MKNVQIELTSIETQVIRGILFEYYVTLKQDYMCDDCLYKPKEADK